MGGFGSGGWNRTGRLTTAATFRLDVNSLNKSGALIPGSYCNSTWTRGAEQVGDINISATGDGVTLLYRSRIGNGEWTDHRERVPVSWEPCRFGGKRPFFHCPNCTQRVLQLFGIGRYLCRHCHKLTYRSQREPAYGRYIMRAQKIRETLGGSANLSEAFPMKPKGMHWDTYSRLRVHAKQAEEQYCMSMVAKLGL